MVSISIIIPIYNVEPYVQRCLKSVIAQDLGQAEIECLIVDDCGQDRSMEIVCQIIAGYSGPIRFEILRHESNRGLSAARNTGLRQAKGDYVMFIDSDDYLLPDNIHYFIDNLNKNPEVDMVMGNVQNCKGGNLLIHNIMEPCLINDQTVFFQRMLRHQIYLYAWNKLIRRSILLDNAIFFIDGILYEDQSWSYQLFSHIKSVLLLPKVTYIYEYNQSSIVNTTFTLEKADKVVSSYVISINSILDNPPSPDRYRQNMTADYLLFMMNFLMNGVDVLSRCQVSSGNAAKFRSVRLRLLRRSVRYGRVLLSSFCLLLFPPLSYLQKWRFFRHHYYDLEAIVNRISHLTDFLHSKSRI